MRTHEEEQSTQISGPTTVRSHYYLTQIPQHDCEWLCEFVSMSFTSLEQHQSLRGITCSSDTQAIHLSVLHSSDIRSYDNLALSDVAPKPHKHTSNHITYPWLVWLTRNCLGFRLVKCNYSRCWFEAQSCTVTAALLQQVFIAAVWVILMTNDAL